MELCDFNTIREILARHGFRFSKSLGQNFLTEQWVPDRIAAECGADFSDAVLEIGPGIGCLTQELAKRAKKVVAVELDKALFPVMEETLTGLNNIELVQGDILKINIPTLCAEKFAGMAVHACANLPYYITSPVITALIESRTFESITIMVQKEVAERICAPAGSSDYSAFSVFVQYYTEPKILFEVPKDCFVPKPKVDSAVLRLKPREQPAVTPQDEMLFFSVVRAAFNQRRKTLANAVSAAFGGRLDKADILDLVRTVGLDERVRGERLSLQEFAAFSDAAAALLAKKA